MKVSKLVATVEAEMERELEESQNQRDARIEQLWHRLDPQGCGELDFKGLQKGLRKIDHPMKNADNLLRRIMNAVDQNGDGKIQYEEFRVFVEQAERQLLVLFRSIDKDHNGKLDENELQEAFKRSGIKVPMRRIQAFFSHIDMNNDGYISFDEWRDFLLFMPSGDDPSTLQTVLSFYSSIVTLNAEGDSLVSDETLEGLGTTSSLLETLFGSILRIASPGDRPRTPPLSPSDSSSSGLDTSALVGLEERDQTADGRDLRRKSSPNLSSGEDITGAFEAVADEEEPSMSDLATPRVMAQSSTVAGGSTQIVTGRDIKAVMPDKKFKLTDLVPDPGYFLAGAIAGGASRTATAPLDRLKVYLLVSTRSGTSADVITAAIRKGQFLTAARHVGDPIRYALADIYRTGGLKNFFAGNGLNVIKIMPETAIKFGSYEIAKRTLAKLEGHNDPKRINDYSRFAAGGVAGMVAQFFVYPLDTLKFRLQCETVQGGLKGSALVRQTFTKMWADGGMRAAYRGLTMGLVGMFPYSAIDMGTFELLKTNYKRYKSQYTGVHEEDCKPGNMAMAVMGATSGAFGASVVYPLNVVRTRLQTQGTVMHPTTYTGIWDVTLKTIQHEGYRGLYKGLTPNLLKVAPALSITWVVYENSKKIMGLD